MIVDKNIKRDFLLGDEWFYIKIYSGPKMLEEILINELYECIQSALLTSIINKFFFIRYNDEDGYHLRIRFSLTNTEHLSKLMTLISNKLRPYIEGRLVWKMTVDMYSRELERYGASIIEYIETIFYVNSLEIILLLKNKEVLESSEQWLYGAKVFDIILEKFKYSIKERHELYELYYQSLTKEFIVDKNVKSQLKAKYRKYSKQLVSIIRDSGDAFFKINDLRAYVELDTAIEKILYLRDKLSYTTSLNQLLMSLMHMHFNRLFITNQRFNEMVIYYLLSNYYKSLNSRHAILN